MRNDVRTPISLAQKPKLAVGITLNDQQNAYVSSYTTLEPIEGVVSITASQDTQFDDVRITFEGMSLRSHPFFTLFQKPRHRTQNSNLLRRTNSAHHANRFHQDIRREGRDHSADEP